MFWASNHAAALEHVNSVAGYFSGAFLLRWSFFHHTKIDQNTIYPLVVVLVQADSRNADFGESGGSAAHGGVWGAKPIIPKARESAWRVQ